MTLRTEQARVNIQASLLLAKSVVKSLENALQELDNIEEKYIDDDRDYIRPYITNAVQWSYTSNAAGESDHLSRGGSRGDDTVRYPDPAMGGSVRSGGTL